MVHRPRFPSDEDEDDDAVVQITSGGGYSALAFGEAAEERKRGNAAVEGVAYSQTGSPHSDSSLPELVGAENSADGLWINSDKARNARRNDARPLDQRIQGGVVASAQPPAPTLPSDSEPAPTFALELSRKLASKELVTEEEWAELITKHATWKSAVIVASTECPDDALSQAVFTLFTLDDTYGEVILKALTMARRFSVLENVAENLLGRDPWFAIESSSRPFSWFEGAWDLIGDNLDQRYTLVANDLGYARRLVCSGGLAFDGKLIVRDDKRYSIISATVNSVPTIIFVTPLGLHGFSPGIEEASGLLFRQDELCNDAITVERCVTASLCNDTPLGPWLHPLNSNPGSYFIDTGRKFDSSGTFAVELLVYPSALQSCTLLGDHRLAVGLEASNSVLLLSCSLWAQTLLSAEPLPVGQWSHVCAFGTTVTLGIMLNGVVVASMQREPPPPGEKNSRPPCSIWIGASLKRAGGLHGSVAEVRLWSSFVEPELIAARGRRALHLDELSQVFGYWPLDHSSAAPLDFLRDASRAPSGSLTAVNSIKRHGVLRWVDQGQVPVDTLSNVVPLLYALTSKTRIPLAGLALQGEGVLRLVDCFIGNDGKISAPPSGPVGSFVWLNSSIAMRGRPGLYTRVTVGSLETPMVVARLGLLIHCGSKWDLANHFSLDEAGLQACKASSSASCGLVVVEIRFGPSPRVDICSTFRTGLGPMRIGGRVFNAALDVESLRSFAVHLEFSLEERLVKVGYGHRDGGVSPLAQLVCDLGAPDRVSLGLGMQTRLGGSCALEQWFVEPCAPIVSPIEPISAGAAAPMGAAGDLEWSCVRCRTLNSGSAIKCAECSNSRANPLPLSLLNEIKSKEDSSGLGRSVLPPVKRQSIAAASPPSFSSQWSCSKCTLLNYPSAVQCSACGEPRPGKSASLLSSWQCEKCTLDNDGDALKCAACEADRPLGIMEGQPTAAVSGAGFRQYKDAVASSAPASRTLGADDGGQSTNRSLALIKRALPVTRPVATPRLLSLWDSSSGLGKLVDEQEWEEPAWFLDGFAFGLARFDSEKAAWAVEWIDKGFRFDGTISLSGVMTGVWFVAGNAMGAFRADQVPDSKEIGSRLPCGLANMVSGLQNVCYQNSIMQALFATEDLKRLVLHAQAKSPRFAIVQRLFAQMAVTRRPTLRALEFQQILRSDLSPGEQMDASDFCNHVFDVLEEELPELPFRVGVDVVNRCVLCHAEKSKTVQELGLNVALPSRFFPITDLKVVSCPSDDFSQLPALPEGYERIRVDLNPRRERAFFFCVKRGLNEMPITEIVVKHCKLSEPLPNVPPGMKIVSSFGTVDPYVNINEGGGRDRVFVMTKKESNGSPITEVVIVAGSSDALEGFRRINLDLNVGGADALFLWYRRGMPLTDVVVASHAPQGRDFIQLEGALPGMRSLAFGSEPAAASAGLSTADPLLFLHTSDAGGRAPLTNLVLMDPEVADTAVRESGGMLELCGQFATPTGKVLVKERGDGSPVTSVSLVRAPQARPAPGPDCFELITGAGDDGWAVAEPSQFPVGMGPAQRFAYKWLQGDTAYLVKGESKSGATLMGVVYGAVSPNSNGRSWTLTASIARPDSSLDLLTGALSEAGDLHGYLYDTTSLTGALTSRRQMVTLKKAEASIEEERVPVCRAFLVRERDRADTIELVKGVDGLPVDITMGTQGPERVFIALERGWSAPPLKRLGVYLPDIELLPAGWQSDTVGSLSYGTGRLPMYLAWLPSTSMDDLAIVNVICADGLAQLPPGYVRVDQSVGEQMDGDLLMGSGLRKLTLAVLSTPRSTLSEKEKESAAWFDGTYISLVGGSLSGLKLRAYGEKCEGVPFEMKASNGSSMLKGVHLPSMAKSVAFWGSENDASLRMYCELETSDDAARLVNWRRSVHKGTMRLVRDDFVVVCMTREPAEFWQRGQLVFTNRSRGHDVQSLVSHHLSMQTLDGDERLVCEAACGGKRQVHLQQTKIVSHPLDLVLTIKRMGFDAKTQRSTKNLVTTSFDTSIKVGSVLYMLYAVVVHEGAGASSGHYNAYVKLESRSDWILFNDSKVSPTTFNAMRESIEKSANRVAYLLFYHRSDATVSDSDALPSWVNELSAREKIEFVHNDLEARTSRFYRAMLRGVVANV